MQFPAHRLGLFCDSSPRIVLDAFKDAAGMVQEKTRKVIGSTGQQSKGLAKQAGGKMQKGMGDAEHPMNN